LPLLLYTPVLAAGLGISPSSVEFDVPADGSTQVEFTITNFSGELQISLEDIPLRVEPTTVPVTASAGGTKIVLTFYGDESLGSEVFNGKIRFLAMTGGSVAMGIKVIATVSHVGPKSPEQATQEQSPTTPAPQAETAERPLPTPIIAAVGLVFVAAIAVIITLLVRRRGY